MIWEKCECGCETFKVEIIQSLKHGDCPGYQQVALECTDCGKMQTFDSDKPKN